MDDDVRSRYIPAVDRADKKHRFFVTILFVAMWPLFAVLTLAIGLMSMQRLGNALIKTGINLKNGYDW